MILVFLVQLLCVLVPCNPNFPWPDLSEDLDAPHLTRADKLHSRQDRSNEILDQDFEPNVVTLKNGYSRIEGYKMKIVGGHEILAFEGIPFAEPPIGKLRFRPPVPKPLWKGTLKALSQPEPCLQYNVPKGFRIIGKEDCLHLNIYTPKIQDYKYKEKLPVIVFIHGGGFFFSGAREYGPSYLLQNHNVIVVVIQYRLGVLGFMSSGDAASPGNWGLKDQVLALKWVNKHIYAFGGDPLKITIMGQSAGGALVHYHMLSQSSRDLFSKAISMSGVAFSYWTLHTPEQAQNFSSTLATLVGCPHKDSFEKVNCLRRKSPIELVAKTSSFLEDWPSPSNFWRPTVETLEGNDDPFLTDYPINLYLKGEVAKVPWMSTIVSGEGYSLLLVPLVLQRLGMLNRNWNEIGSDLADINYYDGVMDVEKAVRKITKFYFRDVPPEKSPVHNFANIVTDRMFLHGMYKAVQAHVQIAPVYSYVFDVNGQYNLIQNYGYSRFDWGVGHVEDLWYIFNSSLNYHGFKRTDPEFRVSQFLINVITNFAAKGEPLYTENGLVDKFVWEPHSPPDNLKFLKIEKEGAYMVADPFVKRIKFWDSLGIPDIRAISEPLKALFVAHGTNSR